MYLMIFEDGTIRKAETVSDDDLAACDDGILEVVNLNTDEPMTYYEGDWHTIESV